MAEFFCDIKKETGTAAEVENVTVPAAIKGKILCALDVAFNPRLGVAKAMHLFYSARIFPAKFFPRRIGFEVALYSARTYRMKRAMDVLAHAADNLGIKKLLQFVGEIH